MAKILSKLDHNNGSHDTDRNQNINITFDDSNDDSNYVLMTFTMTIPCQLC